MLYICKQEAKNKFKLQLMDNRICIKVNVSDNLRLSECIASNKKHLIQELVITGNYYAYPDDAFIRSMCNTIGNDGKRSGGQLEVLDLSKAHLFLAKTNVNSSRLLSPNSFEGCITLKIIKLGEMDIIDAEMFRGCISLESIWYEQSNISIVGGYKHHFFSYGGILYDKRYSKDGNPLDKWKLIKYPSAYQEPKDIRFDFVDEIADYAFEDFKDTDLYLPTVPPTCNKKAFNNVDVTKVTIHVPKGSFNSYWSHPVWGEFPIVEE